MIFVVSGNGAGLTTKLKIMDRNYFIGTPEGGNSGGSKFDIMAFLPSLMGGTIRAIKTLGAVVVAGGSGSSSCSSYGEAGVATASATTGLTDYRLN